MYLTLYVGGSAAWAEGRFESDSFRPQTKKSQSNFQTTRHVGGEDSAEAACLSIG